MTVFIVEGFCEEGTAPMLAAALWEKKCCTEKLPQTEIFGYPFWKREEDADCQVRITVDEEISGTRGGKMGACKNESIGVAEQWVTTLRPDSPIFRLRLAGKRISRYRFCGSAPCIVLFEIFDGCDKFAASP